MSRLLTGELSCAEPYTHVYAVEPYGYPVMFSMTAELSDGTTINDVQEVVEGSNGVHLKKEVEGGDVKRVAYIPYSQLVYVSPDN